MYPFKPEAEDGGLEKSCQIKRYYITEDDFLKRWKINIETNINLKIM